jgi:hypothetical protein
MERQAAKHGGKSASFAVPFMPPVASESWSATPLAGNFLLISRDNQPLPRSIVDKINQLLLSATPTVGDTAAPRRN